MQITRYGHSCVLVETDGARILVDPGAFSQGFEELTGLDAVVITHQHPDHVDAERLKTVLAANDGARLLAEPQTAEQLADAGASALRPGDSASFGGLTVTAAGGEHAEIHPEIPLVGNVGLLLSAEGEPTLFHPGDSYGATPSGVDVLALPITAPWARLAMTVAFARAVAAPRVLPIHDAIVSPTGRPVYLNQLRNLVPGSEQLDPGAGETIAL